MHKLHFYDPVSTNLKTTQNSEFEALRGESVGREGFLLGGEDMRE